MKRILVALFGLLICGSAFSECVIYGRRPVYDENGEVLPRTEKYVLHRWPGKCPEMPESEIRKAYIRGQMLRMKKSD